MDWRNREEIISNILNETGAYKRLGEFIEELGLPRYELADMAYDIEAAIDKIITNKKRHIEENE